MRSRVRGYLSQFWLGFTELSRTAFLTMVVAVVLTASAMLWFFSPSTLSGSEGDYAARSAYDAEAFVTLEAMRLAAKKQDPLVITVQTNGDIYIGETKVALDEIAAKLKGIAKNGYDDTIFVKGDKGANYGAVLKVMGRIVEGGFTKVSFVSELEQGG